jgi:hypothetical protein
MRTQSSVGEVGFREWDWDLYWCLDWVGNMFDECIMGGQWMGNLGPLFACVYI